jgi:hypothetical protein
MRGIILEQGNELYKVAEQRQRQYHVKETIG